MSVFIFSLCCWLLITLCICIFVHLFLSEGSSGEFLNMKPNLSSRKFFFTLSWSDMQGRMFIRCVFVTAVLSEQWGTTPCTMYFMSTSEDGSGKEKLLLWHEINLNYESVWYFEIWQFSVFCPVVSNQMFYEKLNKSSVAQNATKRMFFLQKNEGTRLW